MREQEPAGRDAGAPLTSPGQHGAFLARRTFGSLDGLRALSIVAVVWHHTHPGFEWRATHHGNLGVDLFFVISGFLIVTLLLRERRRCGSISLPAFYVRRALRIFPLFYAVLAVHWLISLLSRGPLAAKIGHDLPYALTYTSNWFELQSGLQITWSLAAEEQFYCVWPAMERLGHRVARVALFVALLVFVSIQLLSAHAGWFAGAPHFLKAPSFTPILLGVALARVLDSERGFRALAPALGSRCAAPLAVAAIVGFTSLPVASSPGLPQLFIHGAMVVLVGACVVREDHWLSVPLRWWPLVRIGVVSYGIYLLHHLVRHAVLIGQEKTGLMSPMLLFWGCLLATWLLAELSFRYFESAFLLRKQRWSR